eukprot:TRINITY_DN6373_c0_g1_i1.p3 TRINITY_DN6373_c0_g1~~TRINITY_DN6373_c0_g1_i1.p3  ORF type:complete len:225 (+),score=59.82 TRINITY_DN6373_c0_g1_i1:116-790(+)
MARRPPVRPVVNTAGALEGILQRHETERRRRLEKEAQRVETAASITDRVWCGRLAPIRERQKQRRQMVERCSERCEQLREARKIKDDMQAHRQRSRQEEASKWQCLQSELREEQRSLTVRKRYEAAERRRQLESDGAAKLEQLQAGTKDKVTDLLDVVGGHRARRRREPAPFDGKPPPVPLARGQLRRPVSAPVVRPPATRPLPYGAQPHRSAGGPVYFSFRIS